MASAIHHPTTLTMHGPWFITKDQLIELDKIMEGELPRLEEKRKAMLSEAVDNQVERLKKLYDYPPEKLDERREKLLLQKENYYKVTKACTILLKYGSLNKEATGDSFQDICHNPAITNELPIGLVLTLKQHLSKFQVAISINKDGWLKVETSPSENPDAQRIYMELLGWVKKVRLSLWFRLILPILSILACVALLFSIVISVQQFLGRADAANTASQYAYVQEAHKLLDKGITPGDQPDALRLLLAIDTKYQGSAALASGPIWYLIYSPWNLVFLFLASYTLRPSIILGVGRAERKLMIWQAIFKWYWSLPLWIAGAIFFGPLKNYLGRELHLFP
jgi:hypothetical protein